MRFNFSNRFDGLVLRIGDCCVLCFTWLLRFEGILEMRESASVSHRSASSTKSTMFEFELRAYIKQIV